MSVRKGQVFTPDFAASVALFSIFLLIFGVIWNTAMEDFIQTNGAERRHDYSFGLLRTSGSPGDWNTSNVQVPGLYSNGYLSASKFLEFYDASVSRQRKLLRAQEFRLRVEYLNGTLVNYNGQDLLAFTSSTIPAEKDVYTSRKVAVLKENGKRVELRYYTWEN